MQTTGLAPSNMKRDFLFHSLPCQVFDEECSQQDLNQEISQRIPQQLLQGFSCCVIAYGATGTGKTHTLLGAGGTDDENGAPGLVPCVCQGLFNSLNAADPEKEFTIRCSVVEIYLERIRDLLNEPSKVRILPGGRLQGCSALSCVAASDVTDIVRHAVALRTASASDPNKDSNRSTCVVQLQIEQLDQTSGKTTINYFHSYDLAASELAAAQSDDDASEPAQISLSLQALRRHVEGVVERQASDSLSTALPVTTGPVLTQLLSSKLGGNSYTSVVLTASPSNYALQETVNTLQFGLQCRNIHNRAEVFFSDRWQLGHQRLVESNEREERMDILVKALAADYQKLQDGKGPPDSQLAEIVQEILATQSDQQRPLDFSVETNAEYQSRSENTALASQLQEKESLLSDAQSEATQLRSDLAIIRAENDSLREQQARQQQDLIAVKHECISVKQRKLEVEHYLRTSQFRENEAVVFLRQFRQFYFRLLSKMAASGTGDVEVITNRIPGAPGLTQLIDIDQLMMESGLLEAEEVGNDAASKDYRPSPAALLQSTTAAQEAANTAANMENDPVDNINNDYALARVTDLPKLDETIFTKRNETGESIEARQKLYKTPAGRYIAMREKLLEEELLELSEKCIRLQNSVEEEKVNVEALTGRTGVAAAFDKMRTAQEIRSLKEQLDRKGNDLQAIIWKMNENHVVIKSFQDKIANREQHVGYLEDNLVGLQNKNSILVADGQETEKKLREDIMNLKQNLDNTTVPVWHLMDTALKRPSLATRLIVPFSVGEKSLEVTFERRPSLGESEEPMNFYYVPGGKELLDATTQTSGISRTLFVDASLETDRTDELLDDARLTGDSQTDETAIETVTSTEAPRNIVTESLFMDENDPTNSSDEGVATSGYGGLVDAYNSVTVAPYPSVSQPEPSSEAQLAPPTTCEQEVTTSDDRAATSGYGALVDAYNGVTMAPYASDSQPEPIYEAQAAPPTKSKQDGTTSDEGAPACDSGGLVDAYTIVTVAPPVPLVSHPEPTSGAQLALPTTSEQEATTPGEHPAAASSSREGESGDDDTDGAGQDSDSGDSTDADSAEPPEPEAEDSDKFEAAPASTPSSWRERLRQAKESNGAKKVGKAPPLSLFMNKMRAQANRNMDDDEKSSTPEFLRKFRTIGAKNHGESVIVASGQAPSRELTRTSFGESLKHRSVESDNSNQHFEPTKKWTPRKKKEDDDSDDDSFTRDFLKGARLPGESSEEESEAESEHDDDGEDNEDDENNEAEEESSSSSIQEVAISANDFTKIRAAKPEFDDDSGDSSEEEKLQKAVNVLPKTNSKSSDSDDDSSDEESEASTKGAVPDPPKKSMFGSRDSDNDSSDEETTVAESTPKTPVIPPMKSADSDDDESSDDEPPPQAAVIPLQKSVDSDDDSSDEEIAVAKPTATTPAIPPPKSADSDDDSSDDETTVAEPIPTAPVVPPKNSSDSDDDDDSSDEDPPPMKADADDETSVEESTVDAPTLKTSAGSDDDSSDEETNTATPKAPIISPKKSAESDSDESSDDEPPPEKAAVPLKKSADSDDDSSDEETAVAEPTSTTPAISSKKSADSNDDSSDKEATVAEPTPVTPLMSPKKSVDSDDDESSDDEPPPKKADLDDASSDDEATVAESTPKKPVAASAEKSVDSDDDASEVETTVTEPITKKAIAPPKESADSDAESSDDETYATEAPPPSEDLPGRKNSDDESSDEETTVSEEANKKPVEDSSSEEESIPQKDLNSPKKASSTSSPEVIDLTTRSEPVGQKEAPKDPVGNNVSGDPFASFDEAKAADSDVIDLTGTGMQEEVEMFLGAKSAGFVPRRHVPDFAAQVTPGVTSTADGFDAFQSKKKEKKKDKSSKNEKEKEKGKTKFVIKNGKLVKDDEIVAETPKKEAAKSKFVIKNGKLVKDDSVDDSKSARSSSKVRGGGRSSSKLRGDQDDGKSVSSSRSKSKLRGRQDDGTSKPTSNNRATIHSLSKHANVKNFSATSQKERRLSLDSQTHDLQPQRGRGVVRIASSSKVIRGTSTHSQGSRNAFKSEPNGKSGRPAFVIKDGKLVKQDSPSERAPPERTPREKKKSAAFSIVGGKLVKTGTADSPRKAKKDKITDDKKKKKSKEKRKPSF